MSAPLVQYPVDFSYPRGGETFNVYDTVIFNWTSGYPVPVLTVFGYPFEKFDNHTLGHTQVDTNGTYTYAYFDTFTKKYAKNLSWPIKVEVWMFEVWWGHSDTGSKGPTFQLTSTEAWPTTYAFSATTKASAPTQTEPPPLSLNPTMTYNLRTSGLLTGTKATTWSTPGSTATNASAPASYNLSEGAVMGIGIGIGVLVITVVTIVSSLYIRQRRKRARKLANVSQEMKLGSDSPSTGSADSAQICAEIDGRDVEFPKELPYNSFIREAPDTTCHETAIYPAELSQDSAVKR